LLPRFVPGIFGRTAGLRRHATSTARMVLDHDATVIADSFCSASDTQILELYALIAQGDRNAAAAMVLRDSTLAVGAGTLVHEYSRTGRLSQIRIVSRGAESKMCWIPTTMLTGVVIRNAGPRIAPSSVDSSTPQPE
jgi:hypothetical protein